MTSGLKSLQILELSPGTVSVDVVGTALPAGVTDEQRRDFYFFDMPVELSTGETIVPPQHISSAREVEVSAETEILAYPSE
jgi:hypothetical protein